MSVRVWEWFSGVQWCPVFTGRNEYPESATVEKLTASEDAEKKGAGSKDPALFFFPELDWERDGGKTSGQNDPVASPGEGPSSPPGHRNIGRYDLFPGTSS